MGTFFVKGVTRLGVFFMRFLFLGMRTTESRETDHAVACVLKKH